MIRVYNTLTRKKEEFTPLKKGKVSIYSCGPTVYDYATVGNMRAYVFSDLLRRMFEFNKYSVTHVMNITDVGHLTDDADSGEDKLEKGARRENKTVWQVVEHYTKAFFEDTKKLNILTPHIVCKATDHINEMIRLIKLLEKNDHTYIAGSNVYFDTSTLSDYGTLAKLKLDDKEAQARVEKDPHKKNPFDFVLWFTKYKYTNHAMQWDSPWGRGFPGWHIECSAMSTKYLGDHFDIHTGGIDHIGVHHTNEIAQNEGALGHKTVNYWLHNNFLLNKDGSKVSKSTGGLYTITDLEKIGYGALDYRYLLLGTHYRKELLFSLEALDAAKNTRWKLNNRLLEINQAKKRKPDMRKTADGGQQTVVGRYLEDFENAINDDLNTPQALAVLWNLLKDTSVDLSEKDHLLQELDNVLGLNFALVVPETLPKEIKELQQKRDESRKKKDFKTADDLRKTLNERGYEVLDEKEESFVRHK